MQSERGGTMQDPRRVVSEKATQPSRSRATLPLYVAPPAHCGNAAYAKRPLHVLDGCPLNCVEEVRLPRGNVQSDPGGDERANDDGVDDSPTKLDRELKGNRGVCTIWGMLRDC